MDSNSLADTIQRLVDDFERLLDGGGQASKWFLLSEQFQARRESARGFTLDSLSALRMWSPIGEFTYGRGPILPPDATETEGTP